MTQDCFQSFLQLALKALELFMAFGANKNRRLRTADAAAYCGLGKSTLDKLRLTGGGPAYSKLNAVVVYDILDLDAWITSNKHQSTSEYRLERG